MSSVQDRQSEHSPSSLFQPDGRYQTSQQLRSTSLLGPASGRRRRVMRIHRQEMNGTEHPLDKVPGACSSYQLQLLPTSFSCPFLYLLAATRVQPCLRRRKCSQPKFHPWAKRNQSISSLQFLPNGASDRSSTRLSDYERPPPALVLGFLLGRPYSHEKMYLA
jgi:hypothetical protein